MRRPASDLNNNMIGGKVQLAFMGDMPFLMNGVEGITRPNYHSVFLAFDGKGVMGANQAIVVPKNSKITTIQDLAGKTISTPIGSSSERMLLDALKQYGLIGKVNIVNQGVTVGMQSIQENKIAATATWEPYPSLMVYKGFGRILLSGAATKVNYLDGVVANRNWVQTHPSYAVAFLEALIEAHQFIKIHPNQAADIFAKESGYPLAVCQEMVKNIRFDAVVYQEDINSLQGSIDFLKSLGDLKNGLNLNTFIDTSYLKQAAQKLGMTYLTAQQMKSGYLKNVY